MSKIKRICVYCGSSSGNDPAYAAAARQFGEILARNKIRLIYGCGSTGLMGTLARAVHDHGGEITGIIPEFLKAQERLFRDADEIIVTADMHERKRLMFERADAFVALPGGIGTLEELVEQLTWAQLGRHRKPILLANVGGLLGSADHGVRAPAQLRVPAGRQATRLHRGRRRREDLAGGSRRPREVEETRAAGRAGARAAAVGAYIVVVIPGRCAAPNPESRGPHQLAPQRLDSGFAQERAPE